MATRTNFESYTATIKRAQLWKAMENPTFRREYSEDVGTGLAFQIRAMRERRGWTQEALAQATGKKQETISQVENPDYGSYTLKTLGKLAAAFDVGVVVRFAPFSELIDWAVQLSPDRIAPPSFGEESVAKMNHVSGQHAAANAALATSPPPTDWADGDNQPTITHQYQEAGITHGVNQYALAA